MDKKTIKNKARNLLKDFGLQSPPLDIFKLLDFQDIESQAFHPDSLKLKDTDPRQVSALIEYSTSTILYNELHHMNRTRFSIAHELGHYELKHKSFPHPTNYYSKNPIEREANTFAAELLMPTDFLKVEAIDSEEDIIRLANKYGVSQVAMKWRVWMEPSISGNSYDSISRRKGSENKNSYELNDYDHSDIFPPSPDYRDDYDQAVEYYSSMSKEELFLLINWIEEEGMEGDYPETFKAIRNIERELD